MLFLKEVKYEDVEEYKILDERLAKYYKKLHLNSDAINKWFSRYPYPLSIRYSLDGKHWSNKLIHSKVEYYDFLELVICVKSDNEWIGWHFVHLTDKQMNKLPKCKDRSTMEHDMISFTGELYYCTLCVLRDMGYQLTFSEKKTIEIYERL